MKKIKTLKLIFGFVFFSTISIAQDITTDFNYFPKVEYNATIAESNTSKNGTTFEKIVIDGFDSKVPFYLIKPKDKNDNKFVILLHGVTGSKDAWINPTSSLSEKYVKLKDSLLTLGYAVIIPDAKYHGERSYEGNFASPLTFFSSQDVQKIYNLFTTTTKDIRIIMDYIEFTSKNKSIAFDIVGYSMGGQMTIFLNSVDDRLNRIVVCVAALDFKRFMRLGLSEENTKLIEFASPKNYATLQKAPIALFMGTKDGWYTKEEAQDFFDKITIKGKSIKFYESGHYLPDEFINDVIESLIKK